MSSNPGGSLREITTQVFEEEFEEFQRLARSKFDIELLQVRLQFVPARVGLDLDSSRSPRWLSPGSLHSPGQQIPEDIGSRLLGPDLVARSRSHSRLATMPTQGTTRFPSDFIQVRSCRKPACQMS